MLLLHAHTTVSFGLWLYSAQWNFGGYKIEIRMPCFYQLLIYIKLSAHINTKQDFSRVSFSPFSVKSELWRFWKYCLCPSCHFCLLNKLINRNSNRKLTAYTTETNTHVHFRMLKILINIGYLWDYHVAQQPPISTAKSVHPQCQCTYKSITLL